MQIHRRIGRRVGILKRREYRLDQRRFELNGFIYEPEQDEKGAYRIKVDNYNNVMAKQWIDVPIPFKRNGRR